MPEAVEKLQWTQAPSNPSTKPLQPYVYDKMSLTWSGFYFLFHGDIDLTCSNMQFVNTGIFKRFKLIEKNMTLTPLKYILFFL